MNLNFRIIGKIGLLLVVFGFFMPIACDQNGFELAETLSNYDGSLSAVFLYILFFSAIAGCIIGVLLLTKKNVNIALDWVCLLVCIGSGLFVYFNSLGNEAKLQNGVYFILIGWIVAFLTQIISIFINKESSSSKVRSSSINAKRLVIAGLILGILGLWVLIPCLIGLPLSVTGRSKLKLNGESTTIGTVGLILNIIALCLWITVGGIFFFFLKKNG
jgi:hypothetical protein